jgi:feruloyl-CoA synthase
VTVLFAAPATVAERREDGSVVLTSAHPLGPYAGSMGRLFRDAAEAHPDRLLAAERHGDGWRRVTYGEAARQVAGLAQALIDRGAAGRPVLILSGNSVAHLLLTLAGFTAGSPVVPVSTAYSLLDRGLAKVRQMAGLVEPAVVFADDPDAYGPALAAVGCERADLPEWAATEPTPAVEEHLARVGPDTVAKILFTSGSTGRPKGVINTHRMLCANQRMLRQIWPFVETEPPVLLDWLPWSHTFGGNHNLGLALANGGTVYIDDGRPATVERTARNLREVRPTVYFNVPAGYAALLPLLQADRGLAEAFFSRLRYVFYAAAALPQQIWDGIAELAASVGSAAPMTTAWGTTETAPAATSANFPSGRSDCIGVPLPGVAVKLAPVGEKLEIRVKGPSVTPGYWKRPDLTAAAFDEEGFYRTGDAVRPIDPADPNAGLRFDGRIAEDFKLETGTWVHVGRLRAALLDAGDGLIKDAVITGHDRAWPGALVWLDPARASALAAPAAALAAAPSRDPARDPALDPAIRRALAAALTRLRAGQAGSSMRVERLLILTEPPSLADGEITDKGYINQRAVLDRRATQVTRLHTDPPPDDTITPGPAPR